MAIDFTSVNAAMREKYKELWEDTAAVTYDPMVNDVYVTEMEETGESTLDKTVDNTIDPESKHYTKAIDPPSDLVEGNSWMEGEREKVDAMLDTVEPLFEHIVANMETKEAAESVETLREHVQNLSSNLQQVTGELSQFITMFTTVFIPAVTAALAAAGVTGAAAATAFTTALTTSITPLSTTPTQITAGTYSGPSMSFPDMIIWLTALQAEQVGISTEAEAITYDTSKRVI